MKISFFFNAILFRNHPQVGMTLEGEEVEIRKQKKGRQQK